MRRPTASLLTALALSLTLAGVARAEDLATIETPSATLMYTGNIDVLSTNVRRFDMTATEAGSGPPGPHACSGGQSGKAPAPPGVTCALGRGYEVNIQAPGGLGYANSDCVLLGVDRLADTTHVYILCRT
jgi:hypothetical protein